MKVYSIRLPETLVEKIKQYADDDLSSFIRNSIEEKLNNQRKKKSQIDKLIEKLDVFNFNMLNDILIEGVKNHKEILKQNEALKIILLRVSKAAELVNAMASDFDTTKILKYINEQCNKEIEKLKL